MRRDALAAARSGEVVARTAELVQCPDRPNSDKSAAGWSDINTKLDLRPYLAKITAPTLILAGEKSPIVGKQQQFMADNIKGSRLHLFEGYGHGLSLIAPEESVAEIKEFWNSVEESG